MKLFSLILLSIISVFVSTSLTMKDQIPISPLGGNSNATGSYIIVIQTYSSTFSILTTTSSTCYTRVFPVATTTTTTFAGVVTVKTLSTDAINTDCTFTTGRETNDLAGNDMGAKFPLLDTPVEESSNTTETGCYDDKSIVVTFNNSKIIDQNGDYPYFGSQGDLTLDQPVTDDCMNSTGFNLLSTGYLAMENDSDFMACFPSFENGDDRIKIWHLPVEPRNDCFKAKIKLLAPTGSC